MVAPPCKPSLAVVCPQLGVKALTYSDLIQAQKEISAHNQQLREQTEQLEKDNRELRSQSLQLVGAQRRQQFQHIPEQAESSDLRPGGGPGVPQLMGVEAQVLMCVPRQITRGCVLSLCDCLSPREPRALPMALT